MQIDVGASSYSVLSTKVEIKLRKVSAAKWPTLEPSDQPHIPAGSTFAFPSSVVSDQPSHPTAKPRSVLVLYSLWLLSAGQLVLT